MMSEMGFSAKRIHGKPYVYWQERVGKRVVTRYIAPLESLVIRSFFVVNLPNYRPADHQFNNLVRTIVEEVVKSLRSCVGSVAPGGGFEPPTTGLTAPQHSWPMDKDPELCYPRPRPHAWG